MDGARLSDFEKKSLLVDEEPPPLKNAKRRITQNLLLALLCFVNVILVYGILVIVGDGAQKSSPLGATCHNLAIRREWRTLSDVEKKAYIQAVQCLLEKPSRLGMNHSLYEDFPYVHSLGPGNKCQYSAGLPYWDWTLDWNDVHHAPVWGAGPLAFGTNGQPGAGQSMHAVLHGNCVMDGPFGGLWLQYLNGTRMPHCLSRGFSVAPFLDQMVSWIRPEAVAAVLNERDYPAFNLKLENTAHLSIPGIVMGDFSAYSAPNDPVFFLHHAQLDLLWWLWQQREPERTDKIEGHFNGPELSELIHMGGLGPDVKMSDIIDIQGGYLCYAYQ